jgi:hypothetical protein
VTASKLVVGPVTNTPLLDGPIKNPKKILLNWHQVGGSSIV